MHSLSVIAGGTTQLLAPLLFAALGELISERAGAINVSLEGMMLGGAFGAAIVSNWTGSPVLSLVGGSASGLALAAVQAQLSHRLTANQFVIGIAINVLVLGLTGYLLDTQQFNVVKVGVVTIPLLHSIPGIGNALFAQPAPFYLFVLLVPFIFWLLYRSRWGLEARAAGEDPGAAQVSGVPVNNRRRQAIYLTGVCAGLGGAYLSVGTVGAVSEDMTAGLGFVAIAAVIFGGWTIRGTILGSLLFAAADALRLSLPALGVQVNTQLLVSAPYVLALLALIFARRRHQPAALGVTFAPGAT